MTRVIITGSKGRMGQALLSCAERMEDIEVAGAVDQGDSLATLMEDADGIVDFSVHDATEGIAQLCSQHGKFLVVGTTGHSAEEKAAVQAHAKTIPLVIASNYSTGVNTLFWLTRKAAEALGPSFDIEVVEMHHRNKTDAPSGTARTLGEILAEARRASLDTVARHGRSGIVGARTDAEIGMHALRGGEVVGDHTVIFAGQGERVELTHKASSRDTFASGALRAAAWVADKPAGLYSMQDVLGLR
jgi:4-hydroxy-tetrahydrodipicolinate reductase